MNKGASLMKVRYNMNFSELEKLGYRYQLNLIFPTYRKVIYSGKCKIVIEILLLDRTIFINRSKVIKKENYRFLKDLRQANMLE